MSEATTAVDEPDATIVTESNSEKNLGSFVTM